MGADAPGADDRLSRVGEAALEELLARLEDPEAAKELPGTGLLNMAHTYTKLQEKKLEREMSRDTGPAQDEIDVILASPLPPARKREQLTAALARLDERRQKLQALLQGEL